MEEEVRNERGAGRGGGGRGERVEDRVDHPVAVRVIQVIPVIPTRQPQRGGGVPVVTPPNRREFLQHQLQQMMPRMQQSDVQLPQMMPRMQQSGVQLQQMMPRMQQSDVQLQQMMPRMQQSGVQLQQMMPRMQQSGVQLQQMMPRMQQSGAQLPQMMPRMQQSGAQLPKMMPRMQQSGAQLHYQFQTPEQVERNKAVWQKAVLINQQQQAAFKYRQQRTDLINQQKHAIFMSPQYQAVLKKERQQSQQTSTLTVLPQQDCVLKPHVQERLNVMEQQLQVQREHQTSQRQQQPLHTWPQVLHQLQQQPQIMQHRSRGSPVIQLHIQQQRPAQCGKPQTWTQFPHLRGHQEQSPTSDHGQPGLSGAGKWPLDQSVQQQRPRLQFSTQSSPTPPTVEQHKQLWQQPVVMQPLQPQTAPKSQILQLKSPSQPSTSYNSLQKAPFVSQAHQRSELLQPPRQQLHQGQVCRSLPQIWLQQHQVRPQGQEFLTSQSRFVQCEEVQQHQNYYQPEPIGRCPKQADADVPNPMTFEEQAAKMLKDATEMNSEEKKQLIRELQVNAAEYFFQNPVVYQFLCAATAASLRIFRRMYNNFPFVYGRITPDSAKYYEEFKLFIPDNILTRGADMIFNQWEADGFFEGELSVDVFQTLRHCPRYLKHIRKHKGEPEEGGAPYVFTLAEIDGDA